MATNFPTSLDSLTNPTASDKLNSVTVPHASQHADINDAVEALEAKVGVDGSAVTSSLDYKMAKQSVVPYDDASARTAAVPSPVEGEVSYLKDTNTVEVYNGSAWAAVGGLVPISTTTVGTAVSSVTISDCFSADYDDYRVIWSGGLGSTTTNIGVQVGGVTSTDYLFAESNVNYTTGATVTGNSNASSAVRQIGRMSTSYGYVDLHIRGPFLTTQTFFSAPYHTTGTAGWAAGLLNDTTSHTSVTLLTSSGTMTGGTITVYGYAKA